VIERRVNSMEREPIPLQMAVNTLGNGKMGSFRVKVIINANPRSFTLVNSKKEKNMGRGLSTMNKVIVS